MEPLAKINTTWYNMISRCCKPGYRDYPRYGGRGISVCENWKTRANFVNDMFTSMCIHMKEFGSRNTTLDRIDGAKGYSKENCRWATNSAQVENKLLKQVDSRTIVLVDIKAKESFEFSKIADASRFLSGDFNSNRRAISEYLNGGRNSIKGYWLYTKHQIQKGELLMAMRDEIYKAIMAGGATKESLLKLTGTTEKGLASQFTYLRMTGKCPMKQDDGTFRIVPADVWEANRGTSGAKADANATPEEKVAKAEKQSQKAQVAFDNAQKNAEANPDNELMRLKLVKADAELKIAEIELGNAEAGLVEADSDGVEIEAIDADEPDLDVEPIDDNEFDGLE